MSKINYFCLAFFIINVLGIKQTRRDFYNLNPNFKDQENIQENKVDYSDRCDLISEGPICLFNSDRILLPDNTNDDLIGYWSFDEIEPVDHSGKSNHAIGNVKAGPSFGGYGSSALFSDGNYLQVPHKHNLDSNSFTFTFWLYIIDDFSNNDQGEKNCPIIQKGDNNGTNYESIFTIIYDREEKNLKINVHSSNEEELLSQSKVLPRHWVHIAVIKTKENVIQLYVNGIFDNQFALTSNFESNHSSLFIGGTPQTKEDCKYHFLIDELRFYKTEVEQDYIQAEASPVLGGVSPNFLKIGCKDFLLEEAKAKCTDGYRLCTSIELHTGGFQIARNLGLINWDTHIWTYSALENINDFQQLKGLGLCCEILN